METARWTFAAVLIMMQSRYAEWEVCDACKDDIPGCRGPHSRGRRRLDLRAAARDFLSGGSRAETRAGICQPPADLHRDQRDLLWLAEARELRPLARGDARRLRVLRQGHALLHQPARAGGVRALRRALPHQRRSRAQGEAGTDQLAVSADQALRSR